MIMRLYKDRMGTYYNKKMITYIFMNKIFALYYISDCSQTVDTSDLTFEDFGFDGGITVFV